MKKIIIIILIVLIALIGYNYYKSYCLLPDYLKNTKRKEVPTFNSEEKRLKYVKKFAESGNIVNDELNLNTNNVGGFEGVLIDTSQIVNIIGLDLTLKLDEDLTTRLNLLPVLIKDIENLNTKKELTDYYNANKYNLVSLYGISDLNRLSEFIKKLSNVLSGDNKIISAKIINPDKKGNVVTLDLEIINSTNQKHKFNIKLVLLYEDKKITTLYYWQ